MFIGIGIALLIGMSLLVKAIRIIVTFKSVPAPTPAPEPEYTFMSEVRVIVPPLTPEQIAEFNNMKDWR